MKLAIDSYCYHRQFGDAYAWQKPAPKRMTIWDFLKRARQLKVSGVSLEACYLPSTASFLAELGAALDQYGFERVWAWGHPDGLRSGTDAAAARDLIRHLGIAAELGCKVMRIVGGSRRSRPPSWSAHKRQLGKLLKGLLGAAED
jgi:sugar phosphate isomerase/epimerase